MNEIQNYLNIIFENTVFKIIISNKISKDYKYKKIIIENKIQNYYVSKYTDKQTFNELINKEDIIKYIIDKTNYFKQINVFSENYNYEIKISKKNKIFFNKTSNNTNYKINTMVNKKKNYILPATLLHDFCILKNSIVAIIPPPRHTFFQFVHQISPFSFSMYSRYGFFPTSFSLSTYQSKASLNPSTKGFVSFIHAYCFDTSR